MIVNCINDQPLVLLKLAFVSTNFTSKVSSQWRALRIAHEKEVCSTWGSKLYLVQFWFRWWVHVSTCEYQFKTLSINNNRTTGVNGTPLLGSWTLNSLKHPRGVKENTVEIFWNAEQSNFNFPKLNAQIKIGPIMRRYQTSDTSIWRSPQPLMVSRFQTELDEPQDLVTKANMKHGFQAGGMVSNWLPCSPNSIISLTTNQSRGSNWLKTSENYQLHWLLSRQRLQLAPPKLQLQKSTSQSWAPSYGQPEVWPTIQRV